LKTKERILQEYGVSPTLLDELERWYNSTFVIPLLNPFQHQQQLAMRKANTEAKTPKKSGRNDLEARIKELEKELAHEQLKTRVQDKMIEIIERDYKIPVRKKFGTKQFEK
jgi:hypothetical protein